VGLDRVLPVQPISVPGQAGIAVAGYQRSSNASATRCAGTIAAARLARSSRWRGKQQLKTRCHASMLSVEPLESGQSVGHVLALASEVFLIRCRDMVEAFALVAAVFAWPTRTAERLSQGRASPAVASVGAQWPVVCEDMNPTDRGHRRILRTTSQGVLRYPRQRGQGATSVGRMPTTLVTARGGPTADPQSTFGRRDWSRSTRSMNGKGWPP
jgi:hypothetical protein